MPLYFLLIFQTYKGMAFSLDHVKSCIHYWTVRSHLFDAFQASATAKCLEQNFGICKCPLQSPFIVGLFHDETIPVSKGFPQLAKNSLHYHGKQTITYKYAQKLKCISNKILYMYTKKTKHYLNYKPLKQSQRQIFTIVQYMAVLIISSQQLP